MSKMAQMVIEMKMNFFGVKHNITYSGNSILSKAYKSGKICKIKIKEKSKIKISNNLLVSSYFYWLPQGKPVGQRALELLLFFG